MRPFRPSLPPPPPSPEYRMHDLNKRLSMRPEVKKKFLNKNKYSKKKQTVCRNAIVNGGMHSLMNFLKKMLH
jgi:hypothetical protein